MQKYLLLFVIALVLTGCNSEAKIKEEVTGYVSQADEYRESGRLDAAIDVYNKALELKEDSAIRDKLSETTLEKETVEKMKLVLDTFEEVKTYYLQDSEYISPVKIKEATDKLRPVIDELEGMDDSKDTEINLLVKEIKEGLDYKQVKNYVESNVTDDSETMEDLAFASQDFQMLNEVGSGMFNIIGKYIENIAGMEVPSKYQEN